MVIQPKVDKWLLANLVCPQDQSRLSALGKNLACPAGHQYPVVRGVPVMLRSDGERTHGDADASLKQGWLAQESGAGAGDDYFLESVGVSEGQRAKIRREIESRPSDGIDPVVRYSVGHTCGLLYDSAVGNLSAYPIPEVRLPPGNGELLLDIGCGWGRWSIAAGRKGYSPVGVDPSLGWVLTAQRVASKLGLPGKFVVADGRYLPFRAGLFDVAFSFGVLQHFSKDNVKLALGEVARVLKDGGTSLVQLVNRCGLRSLQHQIRRGFREGRNFEVRYWTVPEIRKTFFQLIGPSSVSVDSFFGLGIQPQDKPLMPRKYRLVVNCSEALRTLSESMRWMTYFADSVYIQSVRRPDVDGSTHRSASHRSF